MTDFPSPSDRAFLPRPGDAWTGIESLKISGFHRAYIEGFKAGGDLLIQTLMTNVDVPVDLVLPACQMYRHYLELHLKYILAVGRCLKRTSVSEKVLGGHNLEKLWQFTRELILESNPNESPESLDSTGSIIMEFHASDVSGQEWRYHARKDKAESLANVPSDFNYENLLAVVARVYSYLDSWAGALDVQFDFRDEA